MTSLIRKTALTALILASVVIGLAQTPPPPEEHPLKLDSSLVFARGSYGLSADTDVFIAMVSPTYESGDWRVQATIPFVHLSGPATVVGNTGNSSGSRSASGLGDASVAVTRKLDFDANGWTTSVGVKVKFPTADQNKGLGTGKTDESFQVDVLKAGGSITPFATLGYQFLGRSDSYPMEDGLFATAGFASKMSPGNTLGLAANWRERTIRNGKEAYEAMAFAQHDLDKTSHVQVFLMHGFTDASPNLTVGATYSYAF